MELHVLQAVAQFVESERHTFSEIEVRPITPIIGAEVYGVDLSKPIPEVQLAQLKQAFLQHHILVFHHQQLTTADHKRFARCFGDTKRLATADIDEGDGEVLEVKASKASRFVAGEAWHTDGSADEKPSLGSMLYITQTPDLGCGGDTLFANMHLAYEMLSAPMKSFLDGLTAVHDGLLPWAGYTPPEGLVIPKTEHPIVVRHPETGRKLLYVNSGFTTHIPQLSHEESKHLLAMLFQHIEKHPMLHCRVRWAPNTLVFWDNRCTQHHAVWDYYPRSRFGYRISINGVRPQG
jgi:taurine dioxygenase